MSVGTGAAEWNVREAFAQLLRALGDMYEPRESAQIAQELVHHYLGWSRAERVLRGNERMDPEAWARLESAVAELRAGRPLQYVTGTAWFYGRPFRVSEHVLIPRPETEELVQLALEHLPLPGRVLDAGTGSGCIAITIAAEHPQARVDAADLSAEALEQARQNAALCESRVNFFRADLLGPPPADGGPWDLIVSNPPYIPRSESPSLNSRVRRHEPDMALFVPDNDPLCFYASLIRWCQTHLNQGGVLLAELHPPYSSRVRDMARIAGLEADIRSDAQGRDRFLLAYKRSFTEPS